MVNNATGYDLAERRADADRSRDCSKSQVEPACASRQVGDDQHRNNSEDPGSDAIQDLDGDKPEGGLVIFQAGLQLKPSI